MKKITVDPNSSTPTPEPGQVWTKGGVFWMLMETDYGYGRVNLLTGMAKTLDRNKDSITSYEELVKGLHHVPFSTIHLS